MQELAVDRTVVQSHFKYFFLLPRLKSKIVTCFLEYFDLLPFWLVWDPTVSATCKNKQWTVFLLVWQN